MAFSEYLSKFGFRRLRGDTVELFSISLLLWVWYLETGDISKIDYLSKCSSVNFCICLTICLSINLFTSQSVCQLVSLRIYVCMLLIYFCIRNAFPESTVAEYFVRN